MKLTHWFFILCVLALARPWLFGQEHEKPIVVSPLIGDTLDAGERQSLRLLPNLKGFGWAVFFLNPDSSLKVKVTLLDNGARRDTIIERYHSLTAVQDRISQIAGADSGAVLYRLRRLAEKRSEPEDPLTKASQQAENGKVVSLRPSVDSGADGEDRVVILSLRVGSVIDAAERERYELFQGIKGFDRAVFLQTPEKTYYARIMLMGPDGRKETTAQYTEDQLKALAEQIEHFEDLKEGKYRMGDQPAKIQLAESAMTRTEEAATPRTRGAEGVNVVLLLTNGQEVEGELISIRDSSVLIVVEDQNVPRALATGVQGILAVKDTMISHVIIEGSSRVLLGIGLGLYGGGLVAAAVAPRPSSEDPLVKGVQEMDRAVRVVLAALAGMIVGGVIGASASESEIEVSLSVPAERSALKKLARYPDKEPEFLQAIK
jgi:hypothetical protein